MLNFDVMPVTLILKRGKDMQLRKKLRLLKEMLGELPLKNSMDWNDLLQEKGWFHKKDSRILEEVSQAKAIPVLRRIAKLRNIKTVATTYKGLLRVLGFSVDTNLKFALRRSKALAKALAQETNRKWQVHRRQK